MSTQTPVPLDPDSPKGRAAEEALARIVVASRARRAREASAREATATAESAVSA